jgi:cytochrome P450
MTTPKSTSAGTDTRPAFAAVSDTYSGTGPPDPHAVYAEMRRTQPVMAGDILARYGVPSQADYGNKGRKVFSLFRNADIAAVLRNDKQWTTELLRDGLGVFLGDLFLSARNGEAHRTLRNLLQPCFLPRQLEYWDKAIIKPLAHDFFGGRLREKTRAELVSEVFLPLPIHAIYRVLGLADEPHRIEHFADLALRVLAGPQTEAEQAEETMARAFAASRQLHAAIVEVVAERRARARGRSSDGLDLISYLLEAPFEGRPLTDDEIAEIVRMLLPAASESTTRTLSNLVLHLFANPNILARLKADRALLPKVLQESMRLEPVAAFLARQAAADTQIGGVAIPAGAGVSLVIASAMRDEAVFDHPDVFDIDRPQKPVTGFGHGVHLCLGMPVAKLEIDAAINMLLDLPNLRLDPAMPAPQLRGMQFRGPDAIHVVWDPA